jgi:hypothetical protein
MRTEKGEDEKILYRVAAKPYILTLRQPKSKLLMHRPMMPINNIKIT